MARINLLPWRQEERLRKNKEFNVMAAGAVAISALLLLLAFTFLNNMLKEQEAANALIEAENTRLEALNAEIAELETQRENMLERMKVVQDLQGRRSVPVRVWDDIARAIQPTMYLMSMQRTGDTITITGRADNANVVSQFIRSLNMSAWLGNSAVPQLIAEKTEQVKRNPDQPTLPEDRYISFTVTTQVLTAAEQEAEKLAQQEANLAETTTVIVEQPATEIVTTTNAQAAPTTTVVTEQTVPVQPTTATNSQPVPEVNQVAPAPTDPQPAPATSATAAPSAGGQ